MATFILIPGAGGAAWYWHRLVPLLERAGHEAIAIDLPGDDPEVGLDGYADRVIEAIGERTGVILVAQSLGGFTAALVCSRVPDRIERLVFVNAMIPQPGETPDAWWDHVGWQAAREAAAEQGGYPVEFDLETYFLHDVDPEVAADGERHQRPEAAIVFEGVAAFERWPQVPIHVLVGEADRFFPVDFQARIARERSGLGIDVMPGGHLVALSQPEALAERLLAYQWRP